MFSLHAAFFHPYFTPCLTPPCPDPVPVSPKPPQAHLVMFRLKCRPESCSRVHEHTSTSVLQNKQTKKRCHWNLHVKCYHVYLHVNTVIKEPCPTLRMPCIAGMQIYSLCILHNPRFDPHLVGSILSLHCCALHFDNAHQELAEGAGKFRHTSRAVLKEFTEHTDNGCSLDGNLCVFTMKSVVSPIGLRFHRSVDSNWDLW